MLDPDMTQKNDIVQLPNSTVSKQIYTIPEPEENKVIRILKIWNFFRLQICESTDIVGSCVCEVSIQIQIEEHLMSKELETYATGNKILKDFGKGVQ
ncbi:hypothetical protein NPIL_487721 [Nephila pilipes]|uniref:Uncharacterized protein n=1 Tax=Nephila pilipes TaxID=299642 RepID=A0A8X6Q3R6_NEPPI|nr:hypothetical protein NPIL_487721 [Nephila pilipes]